ncbi:unnamed protein product [Linum trigynum]|uniref:Uncharacterized protein n=1 Tax=Linum trigynum TaxID=586398 RepID=A0AAV2DRV9_9ROSI
MRPGPAQFKTHFRPLPTETVRRTPSSFSGRAAASLDKQLLSSLVPGGVVFGTREKRQNLSAPPSFTATAASELSLSVPLLCAAAASIPLSEV